MQLVARVAPDAAEPETRWLSLSGGEGFGFLIRRHRNEDSQERFDDWVHSLEDAMAYGDGYGVSRDDWRRPDHAWVNAPPPVGLQEERDVRWMEIERRRLAREISKSEAADLALTMVEQTAEEIATGILDPLQGSLDIYSFAWFGGGWDDDQPADILRHWGAEFIQLHDQLERYRDDAEERERWAAQTREAASRGLAGVEFPGWPDNRRVEGD